MSFYFGVCLGIFFFLFCMVLRVFLILVVAEKKKTLCQKSVWISFNLSVAQTQTNKSSSGSFNFVGYYYSAYQMKKLIAIKLYLDKH
jgi:hypothetical protein